MQLIILDFSSSLQLYNSHQTWNFNPSHFFTPHRNIRPQLVGADRWDHLRDPDSQLLSSSSHRRRRPRVAAPPLVLLAFSVACVLSLRRAPQLSPCTYPRMAVEPVCSAPAPSCMKPAAAPLTRTSTPTQPPVAVPSPALAPIRISTPTTSRTGAPSSVMHPHFIPRSFALSERLRLVDEFLLGLGLRSEELVSCTAGLLWFDDLGGSEAQARRCFERFLFADMSTCRAGVLPEGVGSMYATVLDGPFVLQVQHCIFAQWETDEYASLSVEVCC
jgi:hypothetical protein